MQLPKGEKQCTVESRYKLKIDTVDLLHYATPNSLLETRLIPVLSKPMLTNTSFPPCLPLFLHSLFIILFQLCLSSEIKKFLIKVVGKYNMTYMVFDSMHLERM
jgi:hypothetical protein